RRHTTTAYPLSLHDALPIYVVYLAERRRSKMFVRTDEFGRFISVLVYMPRDRYSTAVRLKIEALLREAYDPETIDFTTNISESRSEEHTSELQSRFDLVCRL